MADVPTQNIVEFKLGAEPNPAISFMIRDLVTTNPELLKNIIEPSVNGFISDSNVSQLIHQTIIDNIYEKIRPMEDEVLTDQNIKTIIVDECKRTVSEDSITNAVTEYIDSDDFKEMMAEKLSSSIRSIMSRGELQSALDSGISEYIENDSDIQRRLEDSIDSHADSAASDAVRELNVQEILESAVQDKIDDAELNIPAVVNSAVQDKLEEDHIQIEALVVDVVNSKVSSLMNIDSISAKLEEIFNQQKLLIEKYVSEHVAAFTSEVVAGALKTPKPNSVTAPLTTTNYDIIKIKCRDNVTPAFMWMLSNLMKDDVIEVIDAGSR